MKAWFFVHCGLNGEKRKDNTIFCSSTPLIRTTYNGYDFDTESNFKSFMFLRPDNEEMYDFILEKLERIDSFDRTLVWEADL